ncbi:hypothetical protein LCGC14_0442540 [marine sediment metagenome]|uniref:Phage terminase large subunit GpA ATPase domain-containing protein n=1 Tax=marine sediment metagenome TaxID=412755 RepID=A0A0F9SQU8_9ZZZZ
MPDRKKIEALEIVGSKGASYLTRGLHESLIQGLGKSDTVDLVEWTQKNRLINGHEVNLPLSQIGIYEDLSPDVVILKGTQVFVSEFLVNLSLWAIDSKYADRGNVLYMMPTQLLMDDFSQSRMDKAIEESPYLSRRFKTAMSRNQANRSRLKRLGGSSLHMRGSDSLKQAISVDADIVIDDEVDWFSEETVEWTRERLGSSKQPLFRAVSKPTYPGQGIDLLYNESDKRQWHIKCLHCNRWQPIDWDKSIVFHYDNAVQAVTDVKVLCSNEKCRLPIDRLGSGEWVAAHPGRRVHGYHLSRLLSPLANLISMAEDSLRVSDIPILQRFYNSGLGLAYAPKGGRIDSSELKYDPDITLHTADQGFGGVDVGLKLHAAVIERNGDRWEVRQLEEFDTFEELDHWFSRNNIKTCIIDARGDPRATTEWAEKYIGRVYRWNHVENTNDVRYTEDTNEVKLNRTSLLDMMYTACREERIVFPTDIRNIPSFLSHLRALVRELVKDPRLNKLIPRYVGTAPDHYAFALSYAVLAAGENTASPPPTPIDKEAVVFAGQQSSSSWTGIGKNRGWRHVG